MFHEEGWGYLKIGETLYQLEHEKIAPDYPLHNIRRSDTKYIFRKILPPELLIGVLKEDVKKESKGCHLIRVVERFLP